MARRALWSKMAAVAGATLALGLECGGGGLTPANWSVGVARASGPVQALAPLLDEPFLVQQVAGEESPATVRAAMWPVMFGKTFAGEQSQLCLGCEVAPGEFELVATDAIDSELPRQIVGRVWLASAPQTVPWLPQMAPLSFQNEVASTTLFSTIQTESKAVTAFVRSDSGHWTFASGLLLSVDHEVTATGVNERQITKILMPFATHGDATEAGVWLTNFVAGGATVVDVASLLVPHSNEGDTIAWLEAYLAGNAPLMRPVMMPFPGIPEPNPGFWACLAAEGCSRRGG